MEAVLSQHHLLKVPEGLQEPAQPMARYIHLHCDDKAVMVQGVIGLPEVQEYQKEGVVVYAGELLVEL